MKVKHIASVVIIIITIVGLTLGWVEEEVTPLGLLTVISGVISFFVVTGHLYDNWNKKIF